MQIYLYKFACLHPSTGAHQRSQSYFLFRLRRAVYLGTLAFVVATQSGCWGSGSEPEPEPEAKEIKADKDSLSTEVPEAELIKLSKKLYQVGMYTVARDSLASLKDRYPLGAYATFAELKHADSFFFNREYNEAAKSYESFIKNYPGSSDLPYVKLQAARSHIASARDAGRDRQPWERGLTIYDELVSNYAGTSYADIARTERVAVVRELTAYDREIIDFYRKQGNQAAVEAREKRFNERWGSRVEDLKSSEESVAVSTKKTLGDLHLTAVDQPTPVATAEISDEYPSQPSEQNQSAQSELRPLAEGQIAIQSVECYAAGGHAAGGHGEDTGEDTGEDIPFAVLELTRLPDSLQDASEPAKLISTGGQVKIEALGLASRQSAWDCFGSRDLTLTDKGDLTLQTEHDFIITTLPDPPRILLSRGN